MCEASDFEFEDHIELDEAVIITSLLLGVSMDVARLMIRDAIAKGELIGFMERRGRVERMTPDDVERVQ